MAGGIGKPGIDYSFDRPGGAAIKAAGFEYAIRYVPYPGDGGKGLTKPEVMDLHANGIAIGLVYESTAERHLAGGNAGVADARRCEEAIAALGFPDHLPIYFAVDFDTTPQQQTTINAYQLGAASVLGMGRTGVYGSYYVIERCKAAGTATWFWQTYAWSGGQVSQHNHLYQYLNGQTLNGAAVDYNDAYGLTQGLWFPSGNALPVSRAEFDALLARVDRIDYKAIVLGTDHQGYDILNDNLNTVVLEHTTNHPGPTKIPAHEHIPGGVKP